MQETTSKAGESAPLATTLYMQAGTSFSFDNLGSYSKKNRRILIWRTLPPPCLLGPEMSQAKTVRSHYCSLPPCPCNSRI